MAFTTEQQGRIDAAVLRNDKAKEAWKYWVQFWTDHFINIQCYSDTKHDILQATSWFTPTDSSCTAKGKCTTSDKHKCDSEIKLVRDNIGNIRAAYAELLAAQKNYDQVFAQVTAESLSDPDFISHQNEIAANAKANQLKWIFAIVVVVVVAAAIYIYFKWFRK